MIHIDVTDEQTRVPIDEERLRTAIAAVVGSGSRQRATISLAVVDNATIHTLNRRYLDHDYPTDVLSFVLEDDQESLGGEIIVSGDMAADTAPQYGWSAEDELLLYVIHGSLHLIGYDDHTATDAARMRMEETRYLALFGLSHPVRDSAPPAADTCGKMPQPLAEGCLP
ncbi:MAG TPA: rRNA maturation RNase YbeY [Pirellulales bacterium]